jgi:NAD-reducing hydrogenase small subunit
MSFLDIDERIIDLAQHIEVVYSPVVDPKKLPDEVDLGIIEGAVANEDDLAKAKKMRKACKFLIALGDCAVTGNVPSMRNPYALDDLFSRAFHENAQAQPQSPDAGVPALLTRARPVHELVKVDLFVPGCPPPADAIYFVLGELLAGRTPDTSKVTRFGA